MGESIEYPNEYATFILNSIMQHPNDSTSFIFDSGDQSVVEEVVIESDADLNLISDQQSMEIDYLTYDEIVSDKTHFTVITTEKSNAVSETNYMENDRIETINIPGGEMEIPVNTSQLECRVCGLTFIYENTRRRHENKKHGLSDNVPVDIPKPQVPEEKDVGQLLCRLCHERFRTVGRRRKHERMHHNVSNTMGSHIFCSECNLTICKVKQLREHLQSMHGMEMRKEDHVFPNMTDFYRWKEEMEIKSLANFIIRQSNKASGNRVKYYFCCNRTGVYSNFHASRKRILPQRSSVKMGIACTAAMIVLQDSNKVAVQYYPEHYGHVSSSNTKKKVKGMPATDSESDDSIEDFKSLLHNEEFFQMFIIKKRYHHFIDRVFKQHFMLSYMSEAHCINRFVHLCNELIEDTPILLYLPESYNQNFLLVIMTEFQKHTLITAKRDVICVDSFVRRKGQVPVLDVIYVVDDNGIAFPVAFCIAHKTSEGVVEKFFNAIKESVGKLSFNYFMSNQNTVYFKKWVEIMEGEPKFLLNRWEVDNMFRKQLVTLKTINKNDIYQSWRMIMTCKNSTKFFQLTNNFLESLTANDKTKALGDFVEQRLVPDAKRWASVHRPFSSVTDTYLELMHEVFFFCNKSARNQRIDKVAFVLIKIIRKLLLEQLVKNEANIELAVECMQKFHGLSATIPSQNIFSLDIDKWKVTTEDAEEVAFVVLEFKSCPESCLLKCADCCVCIHMLSCSCVQNMVNADLCPHIHAVSMKHSLGSMSEQLSPEDDNSMVESNDDESSSLDAVTERIKALLELIKSSGNKLTDIELDSVMQKLNEASNLVHNSAEPVMHSTLTDPLFHSLIERQSLKTETVDPGIFSFSNANSNSTTNLVSNSDIQSTTQAYILMPISDASSVSLKAEVTTPLPNGNAQTFALVSVPQTVSAAQAPSTNKARKSSNTLLESKIRVIHHPSVV